MVVNHTGMPRNSTPDGLDHWRHGMRQLAELPMVSGETGAAALAGLEALAEWADQTGQREATGLTPTATVLVLCTEGDTDPDNYEAIVGRPAAEVRAKGPAPEPSVGPRSG